jgi:TolA-binding protein
MHKRERLPRQLALFSAPAAKGKRYVPTYAGDFTATHAQLDAIRADFRGLKPYEGRCHGCGKIISSKAPNCGRRSCPAVFKNWSRDQRRVVAEALRTYGGLLLLTDVTLPGTPEHERNRPRVALPWADVQRTRVEPKALHKANGRFQRRMRWLKRKAYNDARAVLTKAGYEYKSLPPVLVGNLEPQRRGALHAHLALPYTTPLEMTFTRAFIDSMKKWAPLCGLGHVQGWRAAERSAVIGGILAYLAQLPVVTGSEVENLREVGTRYRKSMSAQVGQVTGEVNSLSGTVQELSQQVEEQKNQIAAEAGRLEEALTTNAASFDQTQTEREQRFTQQLTDFEPRLQDVLENSTTALAEALGDLTTKANTAWDEVAALKERAETASNYLGINALAAGYSQTADSEDTRAFWLRLSAVGCFLGAIGVSAFALVYHVTHAFTLDGFLAKAGVSIPILVLAGYLAREASKHSERGNFSRLRQRQLESLPAYVDGLQVEKRAVLYEALAPGFFSPVLSPKQEKEGATVPDPVRGAIDLLIEAAKKPE